MRACLTFTMVVAALILAGPALAATKADHVANGIRLECSLLQGGGATIANRSPTDVAAGSYIELRSNAGSVITILAPRVIPVKGRTNIRSTTLTGSTCTAQTQMVLSQ